MNNKKYYFAVDLGATSGRTIIGSLSEGKFCLEELTRFDNNLIQTGGHFYWDIYALYQEIIKGLKLARNAASTYRASVSTPGDATSYTLPRTEPYCAIRWLTATHTPWA